MSRDDLERLRTVAATITAEIRAYCIAGIAMPRVRLQELRDALEPLTFETQRAWNDLPPESRRMVEGARARMVAARQCDAPDKFRRGKASETA
jgi:hypothetical protein